MAAAYTEKEIDEIAAWLKEGLSASRIAGRFSALRGAPVSRNAIIGMSTAMPACAPSASPTPRAAEPAAGRGNMPGRIVQAGGAER